VVAELLIDVVSVLVGEFVVESNSPTSVIVCPAVAVIVPVTWYVSRNCVVVTAEHTPLTRVSGAAKRASHPTWPSP
jgi:hypothetical protein